MLLVSLSTEGVLHLDPSLFTRGGGITDKNKEVITNFLKTEGSRVKCIDNGFSGLTDHQFQEIINYCPNLEKIHLIRADISNSSIQFLVQKCTKLNKLTLFGLGEITDEGLSALAQCRSLKSITLMALNKITSEGIKTFLNQSPHLKKVDLYTSNKINEVALKTLFTEARFPQKVGIHGIRFTDTSANILLNHQPHIKKLSSRKSALTPLFFEKVAAAYKNHQSTSKEAQSKLCLRRIKLVGLVRIPPSEAKKTSLPDEVQLDIRSR